VLSKERERERSTKEREVCGEIRANATEVEEVSVIYYFYLSKGNVGRRG